MIETAKEVRWIQLSLDVFNNKKIRAIEKMPDGDTLIVIWFKLLVLAGQINDNGCVYFTRDIPFTDQLLSVEFDRPISTVQLALCTFQKFGMINIVDDLILVSNWTKYQNEKWLEEARKEKDRERQKRWYDRKKALAANGGSENLTLGNALEQRESNVEPFFLYSNTSPSLSLEEDKDKGCGEKEPKRKVFVKPTEEEVDAYCAERKNGIKGAAFIDYYDSVGWVVGSAKKPMKDWKAAVRQWERKNDESEVNSNQVNRGNHTRDSCQPRTVYDLKPRFAGHKYDADGNDITRQQPD